MKNELKNLQNACFEVAKTTKWERKPIDSEEITRHANNLYEAALWHAENGKDLGITVPIVTRAVSYLGQAHAIPPMSDDVTWFNNMLEAVLEIACPNIMVDGQARAFLQDLLNGIGSHFEQRET